MQYRMYSEKTRQFLYARLDVKNGDWLIFANEM